MTAKTCGCGRAVRYTSLGLCNPCYQSVRRWGPGGPPVCSVDECSNRLTSKNSVGRCDDHRYERKAWGVCAVDGCGKRIRSDNASGLCATDLRARMAAEWQAERRARQAKLYVEDVDRDAVLAAHDGRCHLCGQPVGRDWQLDHVIPIAAGGPHCFGNAAPSHPLCNQRKNAAPSGSPVAAVDAAARRAFEQFHGRPF